MKAEEEILPLFFIFIGLKFSSINFFIELNAQPKTMYGLKISKLVVDSLAKSFYIEIAVGFSQRINEHSCILALAKQKHYFNIDLSR